MSVMSVIILTIMVMEQNKAFRKEDILDGICGVMAQLEQGKEETHMGSGSR